MIKSIKIFIVIFLCLVFYIENTYAQDSYYHSPVDFPISLSGNVGEIRSNHFHTGLDIRGGGVVGAPVSSVADGYVWRIFVSPYGFGNALYVKNSNGTTAVYGHLDRFISRIAAWVERQQYAKKSFSVDLYPPSTLFPVSRGEKIAYLGNSGASGGPHLHFELRDARTMNPMNIGHQRIFNIVDKLPPVVRKIYLYQQDTVLGVPIFRLTSSIDVSRTKSGAVVLSDSVLNFDRPAYLAYQTLDYKNGANFTMGIYSVNQRVNGATNFSYQLDQISFATTRYANTLAEYDLNRKFRGDVIRAYISSNNLLNNYLADVNSGVILPDCPYGRRKMVSTTFVDDNDNATTLNFYLERRKSTSAKLIPDKNVSIVEWNRDFVYSNDYMKVIIPAKTLYDTNLIPFSYDGKSYHIGDPSIPLQRYITLYTIDLIEPRLRSKALFVTPSGSSAGGYFDNGQMVLKIRNFGVYSIAYDTIKPTINMLKFGTNNRLAFKITDNLSGIASYQLMIDSEWALAKYDPKTNSLVHHFIRKSDVIKERNVVLKVTDAKGNENIFKTKLQW
ncbi:MAG: M23 family metallopeptidase [Mucinivorans sp.]